MSGRRIAVIGGGIIGLATAWRLQQRGDRVTVLDAATPGEGTSSVAAGMLAPLCEADELAADTHAMAVASAQRWPAFARALEAATGRNVGFRTGGTLLVATDGDEWIALQHHAATLARDGLHYEPLSVRELRRREPALHPRIAGGYAAPDDHQVDAQAAVAALLCAATGEGVEIRPNVEIGRLVDEIDTVTLHDATDRPVGTYEGVVVATGAAARNLLPDLCPEPVIPVQGQVVVLRGERLLDHVVRTPRVYLVPRDEGHLVVGATMEERGHDRTARVRPVLHLLREATRVLPGAEELEIVALRCGLRPTFGDGRPRVGPTHHPRVALALGHHRHGVLLAPETAHRLATAWEPEARPVPLSG